MAILIKCISCNLVWDKENGYIDPNGEEYHKHVSHGICSNCLRENCLELFRSRQRKEGNFDCFGRANGYCDQLNCKYRNVCLGLSKTLESKGEYMKKCNYCGREYFVGQNGFCSSTCEEIANHDMMNVCQICQGVFPVSFLTRERRVCSTKCADTFFSQMVSGNSKLFISFLCPVCYQEHAITDKELLFFDTRDCADKFIKQYGKGTVLDLISKFRSSFYSCQRCNKQLHLRIVRSKGDLLILCSECASFLKSDWNEEETFVTTLENYDLDDVHPLHKSYPFDAGQDLKTLENYQLEPGESHFFSTGVSMQIPPDSVGLIKPRSGLAKKFNISILGGVVDSNYRGEILVGLVNLGSRSVQFRKGDRIAQILILQVHPRLSTLTSSLSSTDRGEGGFGHTGM